MRVSRDALPLRDVLKEENVSDYWGDRISVDFLTMGMGSI
jgi:hypothetical protein